MRAPIIPLAFSNAPPPRITYTIPGLIRWPQMPTPCQLCPGHCPTCLHISPHLDLGAGHKWAAPDRSHALFALDARDFGQPIIHNLEFPLPFPPGWAAHISANHVFEHIPHWHTLLEDCHRILRPGGELHLTVPNSPHVNALGDPTHVSYFSHITLNYAIEPQVHVDPLVWPYNHFLQSKPQRVTDDEITWTLIKDNTCQT